MKIVPCIFLAGLVVLIGCAHRSPVAGGAYTLEEKSGYSLLLPPLSTSTADPDFQTSTLTLPHQKLAIPQNCAIHGSVFFFTPSRSHQGEWTIQTLSAQGWSHRAGNLDLHSEWNHFLSALLALQQQSCFPQNQSFFDLRRAIAEKIPIPATEAAFFFYSFGGSGFVDLAPDMQIKIEKPFLDDSATTRSAYKGSLEADYRIVNESTHGVKLLLSHRSKRLTEHSSQTSHDQIFKLSKESSTTPLLKLFLQSIGDGKNQQPAILLGASTIRELEQATRQINETNRKGCPQISAPSIKCIFFGADIAVSLLSSVHLNGEPELSPFGTTVEQAIDLKTSVKGRPDEANEAQALRTLHLTRALLNGSYAEVNFPKTQEAISQIVLLPGDRLSWSR